MSSETNLQARNGPRRMPVTLWDILFWAGLGLLGMYTLRDLMEGRPPQRLPRLLPRQTRPRRNPVGTA